MTRKWIKVYQYDLEVIDGKMTRLLRDGVLKSIYTWLSAYNCWTQRNLSEYSLSGLRKGIKSGSIMVD